MGELHSRDVDYDHDGLRMVGHLCAPHGGHALPCIVLLHDAYGLTPDVIHTARRFAALGLAVFAADVWGERHTPASDAEIGPLIAGAVADRERWLARISAAHATAARQPEADPDALVTVGYCVGGSGALEFLRTGAPVPGDGRRHPEGRVRAAVSIHGGLDLLEPGWAAARSDTRALLCSGADDPMATAAQLAGLQSDMTSAGVDWELTLYSGTTHAFTSPHARNSPDPHLAAYNPRSSARAWASTVRFLSDLFPDVRASRT